MRIYLKKFVMDLVKTKGIHVSSFVDSRLRQIEREMESEAKKGAINVSNVMGKLKNEKYFRDEFDDRDWKMIEKEIEKMIR